MQPIDVEVTLSDTIRAIEKAERAEKEKRQKEAAIREKEKPSSASLRLNDRLNDRLMREGRACMRLAQIQAYRYSS